MEKYVTFVIAIALCLSLGTLITKLISSLLNKKPFDWNKFMEIVVYQIGSILVTAIFIYKNFNIS